MKSVHGENKKENALLLNSQMAMKALTDCKIESKLVSYKMLEYNLACWVRRAASDLSG